MARSDPQQYGWWIPTPSKWLAINIRLLLWHGGVTYRSFVSTSHSHLARYHCIALQF